MQDDGYNLKVLLTFNSKGHFPQTFPHRKEIIGYLPNSVLVKRRSKLKMRLSSIFLKIIKRAIKFLQLKMSNAAKSFSDIKYIVQHCTEL
jgi:hypothetical protein